jgi:diguanylate cyclase (GGDEF)-like protein
MLLASVLRDVLNRPGDVVARYGGEEFAILLPETSAEGAAELAEAIRARVEGMKTGSDGLRGDAVVTISLGVATHYPTITGSSSSALLAAADRALYLAKDEGRNRVVISGRRAGEMEKTAAVG